jgi:acetyltransferase-like isoleucine patch superfamily enzyme
MGKNTKIQKKNIIVLICLLLLILFTANMVAQQTDNSKENLEGMQDEALEKSAMKRFFQSLNEKQDYRKLLYWIIPIFLIMTAIPFYMPFRELILKKDAEPLYVNMTYSKDPRFFDKSFRKKLLANVKEVGIDRCFKVKLSAREELIEVCDAKNVDNFKFGKNVLYLEGDADIHHNMRFEKEIYVTGTTKLHENTIMRGILSEKDLKIAPNSTIVRWAGSENSIYVGHDCDLGVRCSCEKELWIDVNCEFKSLYGHPIISRYDEQYINQQMELAKTADDTEETEAEIPVKEKVGKKYVTGSELPFSEKNHPLKTFRFDETDEELISISDNVMLMSKAETSLPKGSTINNDIIVKSSFKIKENTTVRGTIKCYEKLVISNNCLIEGSLFVEKDVEVGKNCKILGNIFSQGKVYLASNTEIGIAGKDKSVIGKKGIKMERDVTVHGYMLTEGKGETI